MISLVRSLLDLYIARMLYECSCERSYLVWPVHLESICVNQINQSDNVSLSDCLARSLLEASTACSRQQRLALRSRVRLAIIVLLACLVATIANFFYVCVWRCFSFLLMGFARRRVSKGCGFLVALLS